MVTTCRLALENSSTPIPERELAESVASVLELVADLLLQAEEGVELLERAAVRVNIENSNSRN